MVSQRLKDLILRELKLIGVAIEATTVADDVPGWDSLSHLKVLTAVENDFGIRFVGMEVLRLKNVGSLQALVDRKLAERK